MKSIASFFEPVSKKAKIALPTISKAIDISAAEEETTKEEEESSGGKRKAGGGGEILEPESVQIPVRGEERFMLATLFDGVEIGWKSALKAEVSKPYFVKLDRFVRKERDSHSIFPKEENIFSCLDWCPFDNVKVVIIGQDPYHGPNQANGLAFSVENGVTIPPSLRNMLKEACDDPAVKIPPPQHGNLECWARQGVLLLNTVLTVRRAEANSHQKQGWEQFTDAVVKQLSRKRNLVYLLWGKPAQAKCKGIDSSANCVITCSHPSPLGAYKTDQPFMGSRCFSRCNEWLVAHGQEPIDWQVR